MLANKIQFGKEYAVHYQGKLHSSRVTGDAQHPHREHNAVNYVVGDITTAVRDTMTGALPGLKLAVADVLGEVEAYRELVEEKARQQREADALIEAATAKKELCRRPARQGDRRACHPHNEGRELCADGSGAPR